MEGRAGNQESSETGWRGRVAAWLDSDLVGIPATLYPANPTASS